MKVGTHVRFRRTQEPHSNLWITYFQEKYGKGPYKVVETVQGTKEVFYKLEPCMDLAWSRRWFIEV
jgi:hypothetical protein